MRKEAKVARGELARTRNELSNVLHKIAKDKLWKEWGFNSFENYCIEELKLEKSTSIRLTNAMYFINP